MISWREKKYFQTVQFNTRFNNEIKEIAYKVEQKQTEKNRNTCKYLRDSKDEFKKSMDH